MIIMPRYEIRHNEKEDWVEISELELINGLYKQYRRVTPAIQEIAEGKEFHTPNAVYRLKRQFGSPRVTDENPSATLVR